MLRSLIELIGYKLEASDGNIGKVNDFLFDDKDWKLRYLVADTGDWLTDRKVLISPISLAQPEWEKGTFPVKLTKEQIENSPALDSDKPVYRQHEEELSEYYNWAPYWKVTAEVHGFGPVGSDSPEMVKQRKKKSEDVSQGDPDLRSVREISGYNLNTEDGELGHVDEFIVQDVDWVIRYLVVDTKNWLPGKRVLISPHWVDSIDWEESYVEVNLKKEAVKESPEYNPGEPVNRKYEERLYDYYGRPKYWKE